MPAQPPFLGNSFQKIQVKVNVGQTSLYSEMLESRVKLNLVLNGRKRERERERARESSLINLYFDDMKHHCNYKYHCSYK